MNHSPSHAMSQHWGRTWANCTANFADHLERSRAFASLTWTSWLFGVWTGRLWASGTQDLHRHHGIPFRLMLCYEKCYWVPYLKRESSTNSLCSSGRAKLKFGTLIADEPWRLLGRRFEERAVHAVACQLLEIGVFNSDPSGD